MAPIYKLWMARPTEAYWRLTEQERNAITAQVADALKQVGGKPIVQCFSAWSTEQWTACGAEEFPDIEAVQKHAQLLLSLEWPLARAIRRPVKRHLLQLLPGLWHPGNRSSVPGQYAVRQQHC